MKHCMIHFGFIDEILINHLIIRMIELLIVAAIKEFDYAINDTLNVMREIDDIGFGFLIKLSA